MHDVAAAGFGGAAETYERARPSYPPELVSWLAEQVEPTIDKRCCDLAAGTGKLTRLLAPLGMELVAIEPIAAMRAVLERVVPGTPVLAGVAEAIPLADASLDAVTVAQAFHWFDHDQAIAELRRVLRVGGRLALVWNARDRSRAWVDAIWSIMDRVEKHAPWRDHERWRDTAFVDRPGFTPLQVAEFRHEQSMTSAEVVARVASVSHVAVLADDERTAVLDEVREVLATHPDTAGRDEHAMPYRVDAMFCERVA